MRNNIEDIDNIDIDNIEDIDYIDIEDDTPTTHRRHTDEDAKKRLALQAVLALLNFLTQSEYPQ